MFTIESTAFLSITAFFLLALAAYRKFHHKLPKRKQKNQAPATLNTYNTNVLIWISLAFLGIKGIVATFGIYEGWNLSLLSLVAFTVGGILLFFFLVTLIGDKVSLESLLTVSAVLSLSYGLAGGVLFIISLVAIALYFGAKTAKQMGLSGKQVSQDALFQTGLMESMLPHSRNIQTAEEGAQRESLIPLLLTIYMGGAIIVAGITAFA